MSKFFQNTLKKEKLLNLNRTKTNDGRLLSEKKTEQNTKKKNAKKFMISPTKEIKNNSENCEISNDTIVDSLNINNYKKRNKNFCIQENDPEFNENNGRNNFLYNLNMNMTNSNIQTTNDTISTSTKNVYINNRCVSPLYTNINNLKQSNSGINSVLHYEHITGQGESCECFENKNILSYNSDIHNMTNETQRHSSEDIGASALKNSKNTRDNILHENSSFSLNSTVNIYEDESRKDLSINLQNIKIENKVYKNDNQTTETNSNYTSINKLNFTNLTNEPILTYIQKDKFKLYNYNIMLDTTSQTFLNSNMNIPCYYCRRVFDFCPLGIPIRYYPSVYILKDGNILKDNNNSHSLKYSFNSKENVVKLNKNDKERLIKILTNNPNTLNIESKNSHKIITKNFFETDGIVCSFNCMVSFINDNYSPIYQNSSHLMYLMYKQIFGEYPTQPFVRSPSWRLRKEYGGILDDEDYNKYTQSIPIVDSKQLKTLNSVRTELVFEVLI